MRGSPVRAGWLDKSGDGLYSLGVRSELQLMYPAQGGSQVGQGQPSSSAQDANVDA